MKLRRLTAVLLLVSAVLATSATVFAKDETSTILAQAYDESGNLIMQADISDGELCYLGNIGELRVSYRMTKDGFLDYAYQYPNSTVIYTACIQNYFELCGAEGPKSLEDAAKAPERLEVALLTKREYVHQSMRSPVNNRVSTYVILLIGLAFLGFCFLRRTRSE
ncbi:MAG: hypothetical protein GXX99_05470 [Clostridiales bacterium]|nr:hypothetical protein [Clostridiales bacterium]